MSKVIAKRTDFFNKGRIIGIGLLILFFLSRIFFVNAKEVFFDSKEYLSLFANPSLFKAIAMGHTPIHEGYILLFWPVYHIAGLYIQNPSYAVVLGQILLAVVTIYCYYKCIIFISNKTIALLSTFIIALTPLFWITNVTITLEISYLSSFFLSLYFLTLYLAKEKLYILLLSFLFFGFSFSTYSAVLLWLPVYLAFVFFEKRKLFVKIFISTGLFLCLTLIARILILSEIFKATPLVILHNFYLSNVSDAGTIPNNLHGLLIRIRNFIPVLRGYTNLVFIISIFSLILSFFKNKKVFFIGLLWIIPVIYTNQWWDSLFMGRYSILAGFGFSFLAGYFINRYRFFVPILILYILFVSLPALFLLRTDPPYMQEEYFAKSLPKNSLLIESHFAIPQEENCCQLKILGVNRPDLGNAKLTNAINYYLETKRPVFVSSAALSDPYGLYTGPYLHPLSLSYDHPFQLSPLIIKYKWKVYKIINKHDNLIIYKIIAPGKSQYPPVANMQRSNRRLDYYDPITRFWWYIQDLLGSGKKE